MNAVSVARARLERHRPSFGHVYEVLDGAEPCSVPEEPATSRLLDGVPFAVKDLFDLRGRVTRSGAFLSRDDAPAVRSAAAVRRLEAAGAVPVATTAMDEYAHGFTTRNDHFGDCLNPRDPRRIAGGSSGGSAAAVALGDVDLALGSDTNGSGRVPASLCGVYGFKPGFGVVSADGLAPFARSLDHVSWFTASADRAEQALDALAGETAPALEAPRLGYADLDGAAAPEAGAAVALAAAALGAHDGSRVVRLPSLERTLDASLLITAAEGAEVHRRHLRSRRAELGRSARIGLTAGALLPPAAVETARRYRSWLEARYRELFASIDVLVLPTTPVSAPLLAQTTITLGDGRSVDREPYLGLFTAPFSLLGLPALSVPVRTPGLPVGVQLVGARGAERTLLRLAGELERRAGILTPEVTS